MVDYYPESHRRVDSNYSTTILTRSHTTVSCSAHVDKTPTTVTMAAAPVVDGNGHPAEATCTYWARCPTCFRLFLYVPGYQPGDDNWRQFSQRRVLGGSDDNAIVDATHLDESAPTTSQYATSPDVTLDGTPGAEKVPIFEFYNLVEQKATISLSKTREIFKAELWLYISSLTLGAGMSIYGVMASGVATQTATWNARDGSTAWNTAGCKDSSNDYDGGTLLKAYSPLAEGLQTIMNESDTAFLNWLISIQNTGGHIVFQPAAGAGLSLLLKRNIGLASRRPLLNLWYQ